MCGPILKFPPKSQIENAHTWLFKFHQKDGFGKSSENNVLEMGLTYSKSSGNINSNIEKERKNDYSDPETI